MAAINNYIRLTSNSIYDEPGLKSDGIRTINTGFYPNQNTKVEIEFETADIPQSQYSSAYYIFGASSNAAYFTLYVQPSNLLLCVNIGNTSTGVVTLTPYTKYRIVLDSLNRKITVNGTDYSLSFITTFSVNEPLYIYGNGNQLNKQLPNSIIHSVKIYNNSSLSLDYIPKKINGTIGLYDNVSEQLNEGTIGGKFTFLPAKTVFAEIENEDISTLRLFESTHIIGEELSYDTIECEVISPLNLEALLFRPSDATEGIRTADDKIFAVDVWPVSTVSDIVNIRYGSVLEWYADSVLKAKYFIRKIKRTGKNTYLIDAFSAIGLLDKIMYSGRVFKMARLKGILTELMNKNPNYEYLGEANVGGPVGYATVEQLEYVRMRDANQALSDWGASISWATNISIELETFNASGDIIKSYNGGVYKYDLGWSSGYLTYWFGDMSDKVTTSVQLQQGKRYRVYTVSNQAQYPDSKIEIYVEDVETGESVRAGTWTGMPFFFSYVMVQSYGPRYYDIRIVNNGTLVAWYKPAKFNSNIGFYNKINGRTLTNWDSSGPTYYEGPTVLPEPICAYSIASELDNVMVAGWLQNATRRESLERLLFSNNVGIQRDPEGGLIFTYLNLNDPTRIEESYIEGNVEYPIPPSKVTVNEFQYIYDTTVEEEELYKTEDTVEHLKVSFKTTPIMIETIRGDGLEIHEVYPEWAVVSGMGAIYGKPVSIQKIPIELTDESTDTDREIEIHDCPLITSLCSTNVVEKVMSYYKTAKTIDSSFVKGTETTGKPYAFTNPYSEEIVGILSEMAMNVSSNVKAEAKFVAGYTPSGGAGAFTKSKMLTGTGTFNISTLTAELGHAPAAIRLYLIGGGQGGESGYAGEHGTVGQYCENGSWTEAGHGGEGGDFGNGGRAGRVLAVDIDNPTGSFHYQCATAGTAGAICSSHNTNNSGSYGSSPNTVIDSGNLGTFSSANGQYRSIADVISGKVYATNGKHGVKGGAGGTPVPNERINSSKPGESVNLSDDFIAYMGGTSGLSNQSGVESEYSMFILACGGCGGGAAYKQATNANAGGANYERVETEYIGYPEIREIWLHAEGGAGGVGCESTEYDSSSQADIGCGGNGGHGGGGGGCGGIAMANAPQAGGGTPVYPDASGGAGGNPGRGSQGQKGGAGGILIMY